MVIQLDSIKENTSTLIDETCNVELSSDYNLENNECEMCIKGSISKREYTYLLQLSVSAEIVFKCDNCLEPVERKVEFEMEEKSSAYDLLDDESEIWSVNSEINTIDFVKSNLSMHMPMKVLCHESCKGLCRSCGKNLNEGDCDCDTKNYDPRFEVLRSLFVSKEV